MHRVEYAGERVGGVSYILIGVLDSDFKHVLVIGSELLQLFLELAEIYPQHALRLLLFLLSLGSLLHLK